LAHHTRKANDSRYAVFALAYVHGFYPTKLILYLRYAINLLATLGKTEKGFAVDIAKPLFLVIMVP
jgi:hypothetical protein